MLRWGRLAATAACSLALGLAGTATASVPAWTTYHRDAARSGVDPDSTSPVPPTQAWQSTALDGAVYGQPLVYGPRVYVATENDSVYALDSATGAIIWQKHVASAVDAGQLPCGDIGPTVGITSTPVIDPSTGRIYVVADTWDGSNASSIAHEMYALSLSDGSVAVGPVPVDPPGSTHTDQLQRTSLALDAGKIIIGYGGNSGDCGNYHGWLVAVQEDGTGPLQTFEADSQPGDSQGAIWGSGNAPAIDSTGDVWVSTGNGTSTNFDYSESVLKLDSNMNVLDWFAPSDWSSLDSSDTDLGSTEPLLLPDGLVFEIGKEGVGYLLNAADLGNPGNVGQSFDHWLYQAPVCAGSWGGGVYYNGVIYVACLDGMYALKLDTTNKTFSPLSSWNVDSNAVGPPIEAGGLIWSAGTSTGVDTGSLYGLDPNTGAEQFSTNLNGFETFSTPSAAGGLLFIANQTSSPGDQVTALRIASTPPPTPTSMTLTSSANPVVVAHAVTLTATVGPAPDAGAVAFTQAGAPIAGCGSVAPSSAGVARCTVTFSTAGAQSIAAAYSGDSYFRGSSAALTETILPPPPRISHLSVHVLHGKLRIKLRLSRSAKLIVVIARLVPGRMRHRHCVIGAQHGRRCTALRRRAKLTMHARAGRDKLKPHMSPLAPGRYEITITAVAPNGQRSAPSLIVVASRHT